MTRTPKCKLDDDGRHFLWSHECVSAEYIDGEVVAGPRWHPDARLPLNDERGWRVENTDPLTVSPSIHCLNCGTHGWWRDGAWVPA